jgi:1-acyl-sn-glycerol-3-phosphate acyltransferase
MRPWIVYGLLLALKGLARLFYRVEMAWIGDPPADRWEHLRLVVFLHHTSLYEPVFLGGAPGSFIRQVAFHGVLPAAEKTISRPFVGWLFRMIAAHVVSITRARDHTWFEVLRKIDPESMVVILPEGRMMRTNGLDSHGRPMTVRGGIADVLEAVGEGRMLVAYSGGLHHVQAPGERVPRLFRTVRMRLELVDIASYVSGLLEGRPAEDLRQAVCEDLERRRWLHCPLDGPKPWPEPSAGGTAAAAS